MAETRQSVSPHWKPKRRLPKPNEKMNTLIPNALAVIRCPNSCTKMMIPRTKTKARDVIRKCMVPSEAMPLGAGAEGPAAAQGLARALTGPGIGLEDVLEAVPGGRPGGVRHLPARPRDCGGRGGGGPEGRPRPLLGQ